MDESVVSRTMWARGGKRIFDLVVSGILLVVLSPVILFGAILVKLTSRGPILFSQTRSGWRGCEFRIRKFRTMTSTRKPDPDELVPLEHPDITPVGHFLRRTKIDELPQLFSVFLGEMSLVGPRPTLPEQVATYNDFKRQRLLLRPGCTGLVQVNGGTLLDWHERIKYDVYYVKHCSLWLDCFIFLQTIGVVLRGEKPYKRLYKDSPYSQVEPVDDAILGELPEWGRAADSV